MKRVLLGAVLVMLFVSCSKSREDKAKALIEEDIKKSLYHPETYDPTEMQIDSAFTPFDDPEFYDKTLQLCRLEISIDKYDRKMKRAKSTMSVWDRPYQSTFGRNKYQEAEEEYAENERKKMQAEKKANKLVNELQIILDKEPKFIGFKARHSYRANNNSGRIVFGEMEYLFDKDINRIVAVYDMDDGEYKAVQIIYKQMLGEDMSIEDDY